MNFPQGVTIRSRQNFKSVAPLKTRWLTHYSDTTLHISSAQLSVWYLLCSFIYLWFSWSRFLYSLRYFYSSDYLFKFVLLLLLIWIWSIDLDLIRDILVNVIYFKSLTDKSQTPVFVLSFFLILRVCVFKSVIKSIGHRKQNY